jgi:hypothetical protein
MTENSALLREWTRKIGLRVVCYGFRVTDYALRNTSYSRLASGCWSLALDLWLPISGYRRPGYQISDLSLKV